MAEGRNYGWLMSNYPVENFTDYFSEDSPVGAESMEAFILRFGNALSEITAENSEVDGNILVVAHSSIGFYLEFIFSEANEQLDNTSVCILEYRNGVPSLISYNDTSYLEQGKVLMVEEQPVFFTIVTNPCTVMRVAGIAEGSSDSDFTPEGEAANNKIAELLADEIFSMVYASTLGRAEKMAVKLADHYIEEEYLNELFLGTCEAMSFEEMKNENSEVYHALVEMNGISGISDNSGEAGAVAAFRMNQTLTKAAGDHEAGSQLLVVSHPYILSAFVELYGETETEMETAIRSDIPQVIRLDYREGVFLLTDIIDIVE